MSLRICVAGATGWTGRAVAEGVLAADDLTLVAGVSRSGAGRDLGTLWGGSANSVPVHGCVVDALDGVDVLVDYTSHTAVLDHTRFALERGVAVVIGSSGLAAPDYAEIDRAATDGEVGVVAAGNFSLTGALAQAAAVLAARHLPSWEIVDYAAASKPDAPSGTARELAERLAEVHTPAVELTVAETVGPLEARGARVAGTQVHSVRLPGHVLSVETVFGLPDERLTIRHDAGSSATPYVAGTLLAVRAVVSRVGLTRGLDTLLLT
ncbi:MAG: 4-hydroxy-tetrahydrodipicolinate reductase [Nocardioidaceae bacterium]